MELREIESLATELIDWHVPGWTFEFDRAVARFGCCHYGSKRITLSRPLNVQRSESEVRNTILHEIAHALTRGHGHDDAWKRVARELGCDGSRTSSAAALSVPHRWEGTCPSGHVVTRDRLTQRARSGSCTECSASFNARYRFEWVRVA